MPLDINELRSQAVCQTFFPPETLKGAMDNLGFVQADPIRSPARAQDLVLRHRVKDYRAGDLEKQYPGLDLEEDYLYAHGFLKRDLWQLLHPRLRTNLTNFDRRVLEVVREMGDVHPKDLAPLFANRREENWWGGQSQKTKMALDRLHWFGFLRVARRQNGIRIYQAFDSAPNIYPSKERMERIVLAVTRLLTPVSQKSLQKALTHIRHHYGETQSVIEDLIKQGRLKSAVFDGVSYLYSAPLANKDFSPLGVKFLAPFDPLIWDRARFEHLWGWKYRFEAYTPQKKRIRGYYAMPVLFNEDIVGWANVGKLNQQVTVELGFAKKRPKSKSFQRELDYEIYRLRKFLGF